MINSRSLFLSLSLLLPFASIGAKSLDEIEKESAARRAWFEDARFGLFIHWGLYSALGGSWNGRTMPDKTLPQGNSWYAEWIQVRLEVPDADYRALARDFNPEQFDAEALVQEAARAGMKYIAITSKHHDGFALWDSAVSDYDLGATPCKRDLIGELVSACRRHDISIGFYYSHWQDWEAPGGAKPFWKPQPSPEAFAEYWTGKALPQIAELIDRYDPDLFWFDTWNEEARPTITPARRDELIQLIRTRSPRCLINGRIAAFDPGPDVDFLEMGDNSYPDEWPGKPWQTPATMQHSWGWHAHDFAWKPTQQLIRNLSHCASLGGNYLLNIGPRFDGSLPAPTLRRLREMGGWMAANGESIQNTHRGGKAPFGGWTRSKDGTTLYAHVFHWPNHGKLHLGPLDKTLASAVVLETSQPLPISKEGDNWVLTVPRQAPDSGNTVLRLTTSP